MRDARANAYVPLVTLAANQHGWKVRNARRSLGRASWYAILERGDETITVRVSDHEQTRQPEETPPDLMLSLEERLSGEST